MLSVVLLMYHLCRFLTACEHGGEQVSGGSEALIETKLEITYNQQFLSKLISVSHRLYYCCCSLAFISVLSVHVCHPD